MDEDPMNRKREGPESRTVVLSPEKKKQKMTYVQKTWSFYATGILHMHHQHKCNWIFLLNGVMDTTS